VGASSRNVSWGRTTDWGVANPAADTMVFATGLSNAVRQAAAEEPT
jgi:hypothetical protein